MRKKLLFLFSIYFCTLAFAKDDEFNFSVKVDEDEILVSERISVTFLVESSMNASIGEPQYSAPDFRLVNRGSSTSVSSYYNSADGKFSSVKKQKLIHVLEPLKTGKLSISQIQVKLGDHLATAEPLVISVLSGGVQKHHKKDESALSTQSSPREKETLFLRAELEKKTAFKGEQVIVNYYLYHSMRIHQAQYEKFPELAGFLKEELGTPLGSGRALDSEMVTEQGKRLSRVLVAQYAAYPVQEGQLWIDPLTIHVNYFPARSSQSLDEEHPFFSFFQQMTPQAARLKSEKLAIEVSPLPEEGRSQYFTGGVGVFDVSLTVSKQELKVNEGASIVVQIEGKGNVASIQQPVLHLPSSIELYDVKGKVKNSKKGLGTKVFEFLMVPRAGGTYTIPPFEFLFFNPIEKTYYKRVTQALELKVLGESSIAIPNLPVQGEHKALKEAVLEVPHLEPLKPFPKNEAPSFLPPFWRIAYWLFFAGVASFFVILVWIYFPKIFHNKKKNFMEYDTLLGMKMRSQDISKMSWEDVLKFYEKLSVQLIELLEVATQLSLKALSRRDLKDLLLKAGVQPSLWEKIEILLNDCDSVRFAGPQGNEKLKDEACQKLAKGVLEAYAIAEEIKIFNRSK